LARGTTPKIFDARATAALAAVRRGRAAAVGAALDGLRAYFGEDDAAAIFAKLADFLALLDAALAKHDGRAAPTNADRDPAAGETARRRILDRREALFPSNPQ